MGIYLDNAATTKQKPQCVINAVLAAMNSMGNSGRGAHDDSLDASRLIYDTRERISNLMNLGDPRQVAFTSNSTEALNTAIMGLFGAGDHIITTVMEHNSVLRPLYLLEKMGAEVSFVSCDEKGCLKTDLLTSYVKENTKNESMHIPVIVTKGGIHDTVYNFRTSKNTNDTTDSHSHNHKYIKVRNYSHHLSVSTNKNSCTICRSVPCAKQNTLKEFQRRPRRYKVFQFLIVVQVISNIYRVLES